MNSRQVKNKTSSSLPKNKKQKNIVVQKISGLHRRVSGPAASSPKAQGFCRSTNNTKIYQPTTKAVMNSRQTKSQHSSTVLYDNLIEEILSFLDVKTLTRFKCVCKSWKTLMSDPTFIKLHLKRSARNRHLMLIYEGDNFARVPVRCLIQNPSFTLPKNPYFREPCFANDPYFREPTNTYRFLEVVGSCNGLLCLYGYVTNSTYEEIFLCLWNPATKTLSNKIVFLHDEFHLRKCDRIKKRSLQGRWQFWFGYDNSVNDYKIVAFSVMINEVRVLKLGDNVWRHIQSFPAVLLDHMISTEPFTHLGINAGVYVSGTVNWLAIPNEGSYKRSYGLESEKFITIDQFVIISLDLGTETYRQFVPPLEFDEVTYVEPTLAMLTDSLCFSHDFHGTHFILWQMKEFGVWTQFLKISYKSLIDFRGSTLRYPSPFHLFPLCLSENGDTLILACQEDHSAILYNLRRDRSDKIRNSEFIQWFCAKNYVESLVSTS